MKIRVFHRAPRTALKRAGYLVFVLISSSLSGVAQESGAASPTEQGLSRSTLRLVAIDPAPRQSTAITVEVPTDVSLVLADNERDITAVANNGRLVTVPPDLIRLADVRAVAAESGESSTILSFEVPVTVTALQSSGDHSVYEIRGALGLRSWGRVVGGSDPLNELLSPRVTTPLGDLFRGIGTMVDISAGVQLTEPMLSDEELIRRLSAEVVRLRAELDRSRTGTIAEQVK